MMTVALTAATVLGFGLAHSVDPISALRRQDQTLTNGSAILLGDARGR
jgi:hypothetical protein